jgi:hypothetical protein
MFFSVGYLVICRINDNPSGVLRNHYARNAPVPADGRCPDLWFSRMRDRNRAKGNDRLNISCHLWLNHTAS